MRFIFTCGDPNGIGPEVVLKALNIIKDIPRYKKMKLYFICPSNVFYSVAGHVQPQFDFEIASDLKYLSEHPDVVSVLSLNECQMKTGIPTKSSGQVSLESIKIAFDVVKTGIADAMITAPVSKEALRMAGSKFFGHTDMLADWCGVKNYMMTFVGTNFIGGLLTIHIPLGKVTTALKKENIGMKVQLLYETLLNDFGITEPKIALLGVNPHAGERGNIGNEEQELFNPVVKKFKKFLSGPFPADGFFGTHAYKEYDAVVAPYHDQLLIPFKMNNFRNGVNYTAGLPIIRTSPDHGTAFNIAGNGIADATSTFEAFRLAFKLAKNRKIQSGS